MRPIGLIPPALGVLLLAASPASAADPQHGLDLARQWCAACHVVTDNQLEANADAPPFATVARSRHFDTRTLIDFLLAPHPKMPEMSLTRGEAGDIAAYIASLRKPQKD